VIKALAATLAPFAEAEKPQLSPWLAASFIKNSRCISGLGDANSHRCIAPDNPGSAVGDTVTPGFTWLSAQTWPRGRSQDRPRDSISATLVHSGMILLIFAAGLTNRFRFVAPVTILQQTDGWSRREATRHRPWRSQPVHRISSLLLAEELGKRWRFLPTYAEVQTSPLLRHPIPRTRDREC
jgi:hypothetical protein